MKPFTRLLALPLLLCLSTWAQTGIKPQPKPSSGKLHVIFVIEQSKVEFGVRDMADDALMTKVVETVGSKLNYALKIHRLSETHFTSQALKDTITALRTNLADVVILYYAGTGIKPADPTIKFANWQLDQKKTGLPVSEVETWLKPQQAHLSLFICDYRTYLSKATKQVERMSLFKYDYQREVIKQLFIRQCGIVKIGSTLPSAPVYTDTSEYRSGTGSRFTISFHAAFFNLLNQAPSQMADIMPTITFNTLLSTIYTKPLIPVLDVKSCQKPAARVISSLAEPLANNRSNTQSARSIAPPTGWQGLAVDDWAYANLPQKPPTKLTKPLPAHIDLSRYAPPAINQGQKGTCVAVSIGYYMRSILEARAMGMTDKDEIKALSYSPFYLYNAVKAEQGDEECKEGIDPGQALEYLKTYDIPRLSRWPDPNYCESQRAKPYRAERSARIRDYVRLFSITDSEANKVLAVKQTLAESSPAVVGIQTTGSLANLTFNKTWIPRLNAFVSSLISKNISTGLNLAWNPYESNSLDFGHAMCVVGYDDKMFGTGAFKLINSWGSNWGDDGYFWISYRDFGKFAKYGYQAYLPTTSNSATSTDLETDLTIWSGTTTQQPLAFVPKPDGTSLMSYRITRPQKTGTFLKFRVNVKQRTYLYLIRAKGDSAATRLLPEHNDYPIRIGPGNSLDFPTDSTSLILDGNPGQEQMLFLFSKEMITDIDERILTMNQQKGPFSDRVTAAFGDALIPNQQIDYKPKKMGFFFRNHPSVRIRIVPLLVTLNQAR